MTTTQRTIVGILIITTLSLATVFVVLVVGSQQPESSIKDAIPTFVEATVEVPLNQAVMVGMDSGSLTFSPGEVSLFIPANALNRMGQVSFTPKEADLLSEAGGHGWRRPYVYNIEFKDSHGQVIDVAVNSFVEVCLMLDEGSWANYQAASEMFQMQFYDENQSPPRWVPLEMNVYADRQQLCGKTTHFSLFSLAYQEPATPMPEPSSTDPVTETETPGLYEP